MTGSTTGRLGVDFGTSHTVAVLAAADGRIRPLLFDDGTPLLRSAVYADPDGELLVGRDAVRRAGLDPTRYEPHPKQHIDDTAVLLGDREVPVAELIAAVLRRVGDEAARVAGGPPGEVVLTVPAVWGPPRRQLMLDAAAAAGLRGVTLVPEPVAAAGYFATVLGARIADGQPLAVFDFGGGTLDVAVVRRAGDTFEVLATGGLADLGGLDLDATIVRHLGAAITAADGRAWQRLLTPASTEDRRASRLLWDDVRIAKETLSRTTMAPVQIPGLTAEPHLTRDEFEALAGPLLSRAVAETIRVLGVAGCRPERLAGLFLVGGSSRVPLAARMLHAGLGVAPTVLEQPELAVAEGAVRPLGAAPAPLPVPAAAVAPAPGRQVPLPPGFTQPLPTLAPPAGHAAPPAAPAPPPSGAAVPSLPSHPPHTAPPRAPRPPRPAKPPRTARQRRRRRALLIGIPAALVAVLAVVSVYVFALHPGFSMLEMPAAMRPAASPWWSVTRDCRNLSGRSPGEAPIDAVANGSRATWKCTVSPSVQDTTTAAYLIFVYDGPSEQESSEKVESYWKWERTPYYDPNTDLGTSYVTQRGTRTDHGLVSVFWFKDDNAADPVSAFLVSRPNGDYGKLLTFWHQHAAVDHVAR